jgi:hypothetical protein
MTLDTEIPLHAGHSPNTDERGAGRRPVFDSKAPDRDSGRRYTYAASPEMTDSANLACGAPR